MKVGIIGTGGISDRHFLSYVAAGAEVVAIADVNGAALAARQKQWGVPQTFTDYHDLLALPEVEAVSVCTPNAYHHPATVAAARAGKHVLCEKPISLNLELAQEMIDVCRASGVVLQIGHHMRSNGAAYHAKKLVDSGELGRVTFVKLRQAHDWAGAETVRPSFGTKANAGGGTLLDNGCHMFDLARYFGGEVVDLYARTATLKFDVEVEDTAVVSLRFASDTLCSVEAAWTATGWEEGFWIYGTLGALEYTNRWDSPVLKHRFRTSPGTTWGDTDVAVYNFPTQGDGQTNHGRHVANFLSAVRGEREVICTGEDGLEAVRLVLASYESAEQNRPVTPKRVVPVEAS